MISIQNLNKYYGRLQVLQEVNLELNDGECIAFIGPNGCGKTTLMKCILGLVTPTSGHVVVNGQDVQDNPQKVNAAVAFLFDPMIFILDEPAASLDPLAAEILKEKIRKEKQKGKLIFITSHILSELEDLATHIVFMEEGRIILYKSVEELQKETGESTVTQSIMRILNDNEINR